MKKLLTLLLICPVLVFSQKVGRTFNLPPQATSQDFSKTHVLVKVKKEHISSFNNPYLNNPIKNLSTSVRSLVNEKQQKKNLNRIAPRVSASKIDLSQYYEVKFNGSDIQKFINDLYATGYFEIVEPDYVAQMDFIPNDEQIGNQYYLNKIRAFEAWDITQGDQNLVIGIVDSGGDLDHPDLVSKIFIDPNDPIDGIDNDNDGYVDNNMGWDFMGNDTLNINNINFIGDNNPSNPNGGTGSHGSAVAGCAAAASNNAIGIAGVGFNTKILFTKHSADNQGTTRGGIYRGYNGILYAATHGAKIINCSWGSSFRSQIQQDLITYVTLELGCLVVASAGNDATSTAFYPASYDYVLSVAASDQSDQPASFTNYGKTVDIIAPGKDIRTTFFNNNYNTVNGTSFSSPITAGAAALVLAHNPSLTPVQLAEQIRVTADPTIYQNINSFYAQKLGVGRLDIVRSLTKEFPSIRASNPKFVNANGSVAQPGENGFLSMSFTNYLAPSSTGLTIKATLVPGLSATISNNTIQVGQLTTNQTVNNKLNPISLKINANAPTNSVLDLILTFTDGEYVDYQYLSFIVNPSFIDIDDNQILTTLASNGRIGFENPSQQTNGSGFVFNNNKLLFEMGLIMGTSTSKLFNNVRGTGSQFDQDFIVDEKIKEITPGERSYSEIFGRIKDNATSKNISVDYRSLVWKEEPYDRFVILEYKVKNISTETLQDFHFAIFADWDITDQGGGDVAKWDNDLAMGYVYPAQADDKPYAGIKLLKGIAPEYFAIDNDPSTPGAPFGLYDGFTDAEKIQTISSGIGRTSAGISTTSGNDVSFVIGAGPYNLAVDEEITIAFALLAGVSLDELKYAAEQGDLVYNQMLEAPRPIVEESETCYGESATLIATGATEYKWYTNFIGGSPIQTGSSLTTGTLKNDTVFFVSNADQPYESVRSRAPVFLRANPTILTSGSTTICSGTELILSVAEADEYLWSTGDVTQSIDITEPGNYFVQVKENSLNCNSLSSEISVVINPSPTSEFHIEGEITTYSPLKFVNTSSGAISYKWNFGDGNISVAENPLHLYSSAQEYQVSLTTTNIIGCSSTYTTILSVITGIDDVELTIYPVPVIGYVTVKTTWPQFQYAIYDGAGKLHHNSTSSDRQKTIDLSDLPPGIYVMLISNEENSIVRKIIKY